MEVVRDATSVGGMRMSGKANLQIEMPGVDFAGMAREAIAAKLTESMIGAEDMISKIVVTALTQKVNERGAVDQYQSYNKIPFVEWVAQDLIREATKSVIKNRVEKLRPVLEKQIEKELTKNTKSIAISLTEAFMKHAANGYGIVINMNAQINYRE